MVMVAIQQLLLPLPLVVLLVLLMVQMAHRVVGMMARMLSRPTLHRTP